MGYVQRKYISFGAKKLIIFILPLLLVRLAFCMRGRCVHGQVAEIDKIKR